MQALILVREAITKEAMMIDAAITFSEDKKQKRSVANSADVVRIWFS